MCACWTERICTLFNMSGCNFRCAQVAFVLCEFCCCYFFDMSSCNFWCAQVAFALCEFCCCVLVLTVRIFAPYICWNMHILICTYCMFWYVHSAYFNINIYIYVFCGMHFGCVHVTRIDMNKPGHEQTWMCPCYAYWQMNKPGCVHAMTDVWMLFLFIWLFQHDDSAILLAMSVLAMSVLAMCNWLTDSLTALQDLSKHGA